MPNHITYIRLTLLKLLLLRKVMLLRSSKAISANVKHHFTIQLPFPLRYVIRSYPPGTLIYSPKQRTMNPYQLHGREAKAPPKQNFSNSLRDPLRLLCSFLILSPILLRTIVLSRRCLTSPIKMSPQCAYEPPRSGNLTLSAHPPPAGPSPYARQTPSHHYMAHPRKCNLQNQAHP